MERRKYTNYPVYKTLFYFIVGVRVVYRLGTNLGGEEAVEGELCKLIVFKLKIYMFDLCVSAPPSYSLGSFLLMILIMLVLLDYFLCPYILFCHKEMVWYGL